MILNHFCTCLRKHWRQSRLDIYSSKRWISFFKWHTFIDVRNSMNATSRASMIIFIKFSFHTSFGKSDESGIKRDFEFDTHEISWICSRYIMLLDYDSTLKRVFFSKRKCLQSAEHFKSSLKLANNWFKHSFTSLLTSYLYINLFQRRYSVWIYRFV